MHVTASQQGRLCIHRIASGLRPFWPVEHLEAAISTRPVGSSALCAAIPASWTLGPKTLHPADNPFGPGL